MLQSAVNTSQEFQSLIDVLVDRHFVRILVLVYSFRGTLFWRPVSSTKSPIRTYELTNLVRKRRED